MGQYAIKELEVLSGIKAHTIRIWEQRYKLLVPERTDTGFRTYSEEELRHLLNIALLNRNGFRISKLARLSHEEVRQKVLRLTENNITHPNQIESLVLATLNFDEESFIKTLNASVQLHGFEETVMQILFPFLQKLGILWQTASVRPAHEHFAGNLIRQKILAATENLSTTPQAGSRKFLLFLPEKEQHEMPLLFANYLLRARYHNTLYLGTNVPFEDLTLAVKEFQPDALFTATTTYPPSDEVPSFLEKLAGAFPDVKIVITGQRAIERVDELPPSVQVFQSVEEGVKIWELERLEL